MRMTVVRRALAVSVVALTAAFTAGHAQAQSTTTLTVPGTANPWLAGMPSGSTASGGDVAPAQSPAQVFGLTLTSGSALTFSATGLVGYAPGAESGPDGTFAVAHSAGAENGIGDVTAPANALMGVFLGSAQPSFSPAPGALDFSTLLSRDFLGLSPLLKQVFFIGDGRTSGGTIQQIFIPTGATRLYLGPMDGFGWFNNTGAFTVTVASTAVIPEPSTYALVAAGLAGVGVVARRRRQTRTV